MSLVILYVATVIVFLVIDAIALSRFIGPYFESRLGDIMLDNIRVLPAAAFYLFYVGVLVWLVSWPVLRDGQGIAAVLLPAALFGAAAYGTYEFTNYATLARWHWSMVVLDVSWGAVLSAGSAAAGLAITRAFGSG
ncbi:MAG: putative membrane protein [Rhodobacteraceae bacterium HLUCCA08]|nr:MAG: putative membrane protein [Rhodobacteraceae bacterium HLUCCA08]